MRAEPSPQSLAILFNRIARIAAGTVQAQVAFVTLRRNHKLDIVGFHGLRPATLGDNWSGDQNLFRPVSMAYAGNVRRDPHLRNHPILQAAPFTKSLVHIPVQGEHHDIEAAITIINPTIPWPFSPETSEILNDLAMVVGDAFKISQDTTVAKENVQSELFSEARANVAQPTKDMAGQFLLSTLQKRTSIRSRNDVSYVTLRTWTKAIQEQQINAMRLMKTETDTSFVNTVASEMAEQVSSLFGAKKIGCLVPMPCAHSQRSNCFSALITQRLAALLEIPFIEALQHEFREDGSRVGKGTALKRPKLVSQERHQSVLLVDDVASSGRQLQLAVQSLRSMATHISAIAWIGNK